MKKSITKIVHALILTLVLTAGTTFMAAADSYTTTPISSYLGGTASGYYSGAVHTNNLMDVVVNASDGFVNLRSGAGMGYGVITPIYNGTSLYVTAVSQNPSDGLVWAQTTYNGYSGWFAIQNTIVTNVENSSRAEYDVTVAYQQYIALRNGPGAEYPQVGQPYNGQILRITQTCVNSFDGRPWGKTTVNGQSGWVSLDWTTRNYSGTYNQAKDVVFYNNVYYAAVSSYDGFLNLRTGPSITCAVITPLYNGTTLTITAAADNSSDGNVWGMTTYNGQIGWVVIDGTIITGMQNSSTAQYYVTVQNSANIVFRYGPGAEYGVIYNTIPNGSSLLITETVINSFDGRPWGKTYYGGMTGWVSLDWTYRAPGT